jgi:hypothetical protein
LLTSYDSPPAQNLPGPVVASAGLAYARSLFYVSATGWNMLRVSGQELRPFVHTSEGRVLLALPGSDVEFVAGAISPEQLFSARTSYVNAILIQSRGGTPLVPCTHCQRRLRPFPWCHRVTGVLGSTCGNCKWPDHGARCSLYTPPMPPLRGRTNPSRRGRGGRHPRGGLGRGLLPAPGTSSNPIVL